MSTQLRGSTQLMAGSVTNDRLAGSIAASKLLNNDFSNFTEASADGAIATAGNSRTSALKQRCAAATLTNIAYTYAHGGSSGVGATLTKTAGVGADLLGGMGAHAAGDRILVMGQTTAAQNGIYQISTVGTAGATQVLTRTADYDDVDNIHPSVSVFVTHGTSSGLLYVLTCSSAANFAGGTATFAGYEQYASGAGLTKSNGSLAVGGTADRITVGADAVDIASTYVGQATITTLGTVTTGTWSATRLVGSKAPILSNIEAPTADVSLNSNKITNLTNPTNAQDAASKAYVDSVAVGLLDFKNSCLVATAAALPAYTRTGNVITASANGALAAVDGITLGVDDRLLLKDGAAGADNGIYTVTTVGDAGTAFVLTRATDADASAEVTAGLFTFVEEGTVNADSGWVLSTNDAITLNTTALTFTQFSGAGQITAGAGMTKTGNTLNVVSGNTAIVANADDITLTLATNSGLDISTGLRIAAAAAGAGIAGGAGTALSLDMVRETPGGTINSANTAFTISAAVMTGGLLLFQNLGLLEPGGVDYTLSGTNITMVTAPTTGDTLTAILFKA